MKLKEYNKATTLTRVALNEPAITVNGKSGLITFNKALIQKLGLKEADTVSFYQDEEHPLKWYFFHSENGFIIRQTTGGNLIFGCKAMAKDILSSLEINGNSVQIPVSGKNTHIQGADYYVLDTFKVNQKFKPENARPKRFENA